MIEYRAVASWGAWHVEGRAPGGPWRVVIDQPPEVRAVLDAAAARWTAAALRAAPGAVEPRAVTPWAAA